MAFSAVASVVADGFAASSIATIATAVAEVGTAMSVVGAVTGNSTLTKIGGVMGLAGGTTALASGAFGAAAADLPPSFDPTTGNVVSTAAEQSANLAAPTLSGGATAGMGLNSSGAIDNLGINSGTTSSSIPSIDTGLSPSATAATTTPTGIVNSAVPAPQGIVNSAAATPPPVDNALSGNPASPTPTDYNNIANASGGTTTPTSASIGTPGAANSVGAAPAAMTSPTLSQTPAAAVSNLSQGQVSGLGSAGQQSGLQTNIQPAAGVGAPDPTTSNDILDTSSAQSGTPYGIGAGTNGAAAAPSASDSWYSGVLKFAKDNPMASAQIGTLGGNLISGIAGAPLRNAQMNALETQTSLANQAQANRNSQVSTGGIINTAMKKKATS
jgi:hypothetical protein